MTLKEFFRKARRGRKWKMRPDIDHGPVVRCENGYCPLGAVLSSTDRQSPHLPSPGDAAEGLGLRKAMAYKIADAADYSDSPHRRWLLKNLGVRA